MNQWDDGNDINMSGFWLMKFWRLKEGSARLMQRAIVYEVAIQRSTKCHRSMLISHMVAKSEDCCQRNVEASLTGAYHSDVNARIRFLSKTCRVQIFIFSSRSQIKVTIVFISRTSVEVLVLPLSDPVHDGHRPIHRLQFFDSHSRLHARDLLPGTISFSLPTKL